jgi:hypothetical protein
MMEIDLTDEKKYEHYLYSWGSKYILTIS